MLRKRNTGPADVRSGLLEAYSTKHKSLDQKVSGSEHIKDDADDDGPHIKATRQLINPPGCP